MSAGWVYIIRNLRRRRARTVIGALGIFLTLGLLTAIQIGLDSVSVSYIDLVALQAGKADIVVGKPGSDPLNPQSFSPNEIQARLGTNALLRGISPRWLGVVQVQFRGEEHYAVLIGVDPQRERELDISGLVPEPKLANNTCALSKSLAEKLKAKSGSQLTVRSPTAFGETELRMEEILERQLLVPQQVRDFIVVSQPAAQQVLSEPDRVHLLAGAFRNARTYYDARDLHASVLKLKAAGAAIAADLGQQYEVRLPKAAAITAFQQVTSPVRAVFGVFALLALTITGLLIYSLISVAVEERIREYAILRTLGARRRDVFRLVLSESFLLCFIGVAPGVLVGAAAAAILVKLISLAMGARGGISIELSVRTLLLTLAGGAALSIGSALVPAWHATRWRIVDALDPLRRGQILDRPASDGRVNRPLVIAGLVLASLSVVVFFVLPTALLSGNPSLIGTVVLSLLVSILLGFTLAMVGVLPFLERFLVVAAGCVFGPVAELAGRNLDRHRRRHTTTALLFTLSVSLVIYLASLVALASSTALSLVEHTHGADLKIHAFSTGGESLKSDLARLEGVRAVSEVKFLHSRSESGIAYDVVIRDLVGMKDLWIVPFGVDADLAKVIYARQIVCDVGSPNALAELGKSFATPAGTLGADAPRNSAGNTEPTASSLGTADPPPRTAVPTPNPVPPIILSTAVARFLDVTVGDQVQLSFRLGSERKDGRFLVAAVWSSMPGLENFRSRVALAVGSGVILPVREFERMSSAAPPEAFQALYFVQANGGPAAQKAVARRVREQFDLRYRFGVSCTAEQKETARVVYWVTQVLFGILLGVAVVIAVFALIASMASTVLERRREIGVLKALGMRRRELFRLFLAEGVILTLSAGVAGGVIGFTLAWLFVLQASVLMDLATTFTLPYITFLATLLISVLAGALAAHLPTRSLLQKSAADILRT